MLNKRVRIASSVIGLTLDLLEVLEEDRMVTKITFIMNGVSNPLYAELAELARI